jgi:hypothetical protein
VTGARRRVRFEWVRERDLRDVRDRRGGSAAIAAMAIVCGGAGGSRIRGPTTVYMFYTAIVKSRLNHFCGRKT